MADPRVASYAKLLVEQCLDIKPRDQVLVFSSPLGRPLVEEVARCLARRGAYALLRLNFGTVGGGGAPWILEAPEEVLAEPSSIEADVLRKIDALIAIVAPENTRELSEVPAERLALFRAAYRPASERVFTGELPWVGCNFPTQALAQDAGMSLAQFEDFLYGASLLDWDAERGRMQRYADRFDAATDVRIVGNHTDLTVSIAGRTGKVDAGGANIPGGEFFFCPVEDSAEGSIAFTEFPAIYGGREMSGIRLQFERGRVVDASAEANEDFLLETLDTDEGARRIGELGIGCNPGITRYMKNAAFDEKIDGTIHIALGNGFQECGGTNVSAIHWDIVKDLRDGGRIELDGEPVQKNGAWLIG